MPLLPSIMLRATQNIVRQAASTSTRLAAAQRVAAPSATLLARRQRVRWYSAEPASAEQPQQSPPAAEGQQQQDAMASKLAELEKKVEENAKTIAELKDARLRGLADFENLQKRSTVEKQQARDFALSAFAKDLISSIDIIELALKSIPEATLKAQEANKDLVSLHEGVSLTKKELDKVLKRHGVVAFDPTGEQFDPNKHEALFQAPVPGKEPGSVLECQEIGYMIKDRLLRPAKVGVVLKQE
ncbi:GrpE, mitochondrial [Microbotryomycetes sp. JL201]|nr:GrpE, mitochondrial [Microbotryomycetes sp. JL201]